MKPIDKLAWIHIKDKKLLVARSYNKELFYIPGGKRDPGESDMQALIREIKEELCVDILPETLKPAGEYLAQADGKPKGVCVKLTCYFADYTGEITPDSEIEQVKWMTSSDIKDGSSVTQLIMHNLKDKGLIS